MVHQSTVHKGGSVGNSVGSVDERGGVDKRGNSVVGNGVDGGSVGNNSLRVGSGTIVGDLGDVAVDRVGVVVHVLDPAVGKGNRVGALSVTGTIAGLSGVEVGVGVVVSDGVVVGVGGDLVGVHLGNGVGNSVDRGVVSRGGVDNRGVVGGGSVDHRGGVNKRGGVGNRVSDDTVGKTVSNNTVGKTVSSDTVGKTVSDDTVGKTVSSNTVGNTVSDDTVGKTVSDDTMGKTVSSDTVGKTVRNSVANNTVGKTMSNHTSVTSSMEGVGVLSNGSNVSSEGLGLRVVSNLSLEGLGDGHMRGLSSSNSDMCNRVCSMSNMANEAVSTDQAVTGQDLGSSGSGSHQGRDTEESLHVGWLLVIN